MTPARLDRAFFARPVLDVAPELLGCVFRHGGVGLLLTEVEAYDGQNDPGSHAYRGATPRTRVMFGPAGHLYVYFTYGMHFCANVVTGHVGAAAAVLLRAGRVVDGEAVAAARRPGIREREWARGPARLATTMGLARAENGLDVCADGGPAPPAPPIGPGLPAQVASGGEGWFEPPRRWVDPGRIRRGPRVGVSGPGGDGDAYPWRFWIEGEPTVSAYRPAVARPAVARPGAARPGAARSGPRRR